MCGITFIFLTLFATIFTFKWISEKCKNYPITVRGKKRVKMVSGCYPVVGHAITMSRNPLKFMKNCAQKYGNVFRIKLFRAEYIVICDRKLVPEFLRSTEESMSLYEILNSIFLDEVYANSKISPSLVNTIIRKSIALNQDSIIQKISSEAEKMTQRLKARCAESPHANANTNLHEEMFKFITATSARCFLDMELPQNVFDNFKKFTHLVDKAILGSFVLPKPFVRLILGSSLSSTRLQLLDYFDPEIIKYRGDPAKCDSLFIRTAVDYVDPVTGQGLANEVVTGLILAIIYASAENTALGLTNTLKELACKPDYWNQLKAECEQYLARNDSRAILDSPLMNSCVMESARRNANILPLIRKPGKNSVLGEYYIGDADAVAICSPMLMLTGNASEIFNEPELYNPGRFLKNKTESCKPESFSQYNVLTWSTSVHGCPGKTFALYEIKMAVAFILQNFHLEVNKTSANALNFESTSALYERKIDSVIKAI